MTAIGRPGQRRRGRLPLRGSAGRDRLRRGRPGAAAGRPPLAELPDADGGRRRAAGARRAGAGVRRGTAMKAMAIVPVKRFAGGKDRLVDAIGPPGSRRPAEGDADRRRGRRWCEPADRAADRRDRGDARRETGPARGAADRALRWRCSGNRAIRDTPRRRRSASCAPRRSAPRPWRCCPATARCWPPVSSTARSRAWSADASAVIPDRHGTGTNGLLMSPADAIGPAFGPGSCDRHLDRAARAGWRRRARSCPRWRSTSTRLTTSRCFARAPRAGFGGGARHRAGAGRAVITDTPGRGAARGRAGRRTRRDARGRGDLGGGAGRLAEGGLEGRGPDLILGRSHPVARRESSRQPSARTRVWSS